MKSNEALFHKIVEEVDDYAILLLSREGKIENWNRGAEKIKGYQADEIIGKSFRLFYTEEDKKNRKPESLLHKAITEGKATDEGWRLRKDCTAFWGSITITAFHDEQGHVLGFIKVTRDLTERKMAEERLLKYAKQLEQQNKELEQFAYIAAHDLQEPLRTLSAFVTLFTTQYAEKLDTQAKQYLSYISNAANRMRDLITGLLDFSRIGRERKLEKINFQQLVEEVIQDLHAAIQQEQAHIEVGHLPVIPGYRLELKLLFQNLISNALKFRKKEVPPEIKITAKKRVEGWEFAISDNGIGIDERFFDKIFVIFQRLHGRSEYSGTGIGLAHCKKIVGVHGGEIWVSSKPNIGSTFYFLINSKFL